MGAWFKSYEPLFLSHTRTTKGIFFWLVQKIIWVKSIIYRNNEMNYGKGQNMGASSYFFEVRFIFIFLKENIGPQFYKSVLGSENFRASPTIACQRILQLNLGLGPTVKEWDLEICYLLKSQVLEFWVELTWEIQKVREKNERALVGLLYMDVATQRL